MKLCTDPLFFTDSPLKRCGGIIVCGLNWGEKIPEHPEKHDEICKVWDKPPKEFYQQGDPFRKFMTEWMTAWGHDPRNDKEFDSILLATNVFYNTTHGSGNLNVTPDDWKKAVDRLFKGAGELDVSAVIISTRMALGHVNQYLRSRDPGFSWSGPTGNWMVGRLGNMDVAIGPHYRARKGLARHEAILTAKKLMKPLLDRAIERSRAVQRTV
jgi:hypothetical protein